MGGVAGYIAATAALRRRDYGDSPELVDVSELEAFVLTVRPWAIGAIYYDQDFSYGAAGGRPRGAPGPLWELKDGRMNFGIADFHNWTEAMAVLGRSSHDRRWRSGDLRARSGRPMSFQAPNGVVDILVKDEAEAVQVAKKYLSYFQGPVAEWEASDQRRLRHVVPENRLRLYDMREIIDTLADRDSVLEIREKFGIGVITSFICIEGRPMGVIANNPHHLAGAIDSDGADKGARFIQLCDAFDIPVLSLMDCPGMMVGPDVERTALVRHCGRRFNAGANLTTPLFGVVVRKSYGLGVQAMCGASSLVGFFTVAWPTAEFAGMNIEGSVKLGFRKELAAITDPAERKREFEARVTRSYEGAKAVNAAVGGGQDDVIDPADTRDWIASSLKRLPPLPPRTGKKYPYIDTW